MFRLIGFLLFLTHNNDSVNVVTFYIDENDDRIECIITFMSWECCTLYLHTKRRREEEKIYYKSYLSALVGHDRVK